MEDIKKFEPLWDSWYIKDIIGEGGFGKVYKIERKEFGNTYVSALKHIKVPRSQSEVKSILADGMTEKEAEKYFENCTEDIVKEIVLMSKLKGNSNIVSYEDHKVIKTEGKIEWNIFIRMELLTGLVDYISKNTITKRDVIQLGIDMCRALETCQKFNIIHRDIKPENIFISATGQYKLGDFGIARQIEKTVSGLSKKGTFTYIAPEVYKGEPYGSTVDIYSLGIVMYRLLNNNRVPFMPAYPNPITHNDREIALVKRMSGQSFDKPVNADGRLAEIVLKAAAYNPKERYESAATMRFFLENILYSDTERSIIYPNGDNAEIKSINYVSTRESEKSIKSQDYSYDDEENKDTELMTQAYNEVATDIGLEKFKINKKLLILSTITVLASLIVMIVILSLKITYEDNKAKKLNDNLIDQTTNVTTKEITEATEATTEIITLEQTTIVTTQATTIATTTQMTTQEPKKEYSNENKTQMTTKRVINKETTTKAVPKATPKAETTTKAQAETTTKAVVQPEVNTPQDNISQDNGVNNTQAPEIYVGF